MSEKSLNDLNPTQSKLEQSKGKIPPLLTGPHHQRVVPLDSMGTEESEKHTGVTKGATRALGAERKKGWLRGG